MAAELPRPPLQLAHPRLKSGLVSRAHPLGADPLRQLCPASQENQWLISYYRFRLIQSAGTFLGRRGTAPRLPRLRRVGGRLAGLGGHGGIGLARSLKRRVSVFAGYSIEIKGVFWPSVAACCTLKSPLEPLGLPRVRYRADL
jgi:hypothetical protein